MHSFVSAAIAGVAAILAMALAVGTVSARNLSASNQNVRAVYASLELGNTVTETRTRCQLTLEGSFHSRTIVKRVAALVGYFTRADLGPCTGGTGTVNRETLPWHLTYEGFNGILPNITAVTFSVVGLSFELLQEGIMCRARTEARTPATSIVIVNAGTVTGLRVDESRFIPLRGGLFEACALSRGLFIGTARVTLLNSTSAITLRLI
jgi:hypothetical protein